MALLDKLAMIKLRFDDVAQQIIEPEVIADMKRYVKLNKEYKDLIPIVDAYKAYKIVCDNIDESNEILKSEDDPEMKDVVAEELDQLTTTKQELEKKLHLFLIPKDPEDNKNAIVEIRSGTGGDEAALFAADLYRMYTKYAESNKWKIDIISENITGLGGVKEVVFSISGNAIFVLSKLVF